MAAGTRAQKHRAVGEEEERERCDPGGSGAVEKRDAGIMLFGGQP